MIYVRKIAARSASREAALCVGTVVAHTPVVDVALRLGEVGAPWALKPSFADHTRQRDILRKSLVMYKADDTVHLHGIEVLLVALARGPASKRRRRQLPVLNGVQQVPNQAVSLSLGHLKLQSHVLHDTSHGCCYLLTNHAVGEAVIQGRYGRSFDMRAITLDRQKLSASQVDGYRTCSLKWHYRYREKAPAEQRSGALVVGIVVDVAIKAGLHSLKAGEVLVEEQDPKPLFEEAWAAELASTNVPIRWGAGGIEKAKEKAQRLVQHFFELEDLPERVHRLHALDVSFEVPLLHPDNGGDTGLFLRGFLDATERLPDGTIRVLDYKTAANKAGYSEPALATHLQACLYAYALRQIHGEQASSEVAFCVGLKTKDAPWLDLSVEISGAAIRRALLTVLHAERAMRLGIALPQPNWGCPACPYAKRCSTWQEHAGAPASDVFMQGISATG